jgi:hypothetical protein
MIYDNIWPVSVAEVADNNNKQRNFYLVFTTYLNTLEVSSKGPSSGISERRALLETSNLFVSFAGLGKNFPAF